MGETKRIIFMGSDAIALPTLHFLLEQEAVDLTAVYTQPDRPSGRGKRLRPNPIKEWAVLNQLDLRQPEKLEETELHWLRDANPTIVLVMAYGHLLKPSLLEAVGGRFYNLHASLLPTYRGASPIETALAEGEEITGVSLMRIISRMDAGPVLDCEKVPIAEAETGSSLREKLALACVPLMERNLKALLTDSSVEAIQNEDAATYCRRLRKKDGNMDFSMPAHRLVRRVAAFRTWPGCFFEVGEVRVKVGSATATLESIDASPGEILGEADGGLRLATGEGVLVLRELQRPGGSMLPAAEFLRGFPIPPGTHLQAASMFPLVAKKPSLFSEIEKTG